MTKVTIVFEDDETGAVSVVTTVHNFDRESKAQKMASAVNGYIAGIATAVGDQAPVSLQHLAIAQAH